MTAQEFQRAFAYATSALELLRRAVVPPYPQFYELLYTYATGVNPALNARINELFKDGGPTVDMAERLYEEFLRPRNTDERISSVSERMSHRIERMHDALDSAMTTASAYSAVLEVAGGDLDSVHDTAQLRNIAASLLVETRHMQSANSRLEHNLEAARQDIAALQRDLEDVRREALIDPLTRVFNRKAFDDGLHRALNAADETGTNLCLMLADIDHFKRFNDTWGHQTGDQVLRLVAMTLKSNLKGRDVAARYGGEEFAAIMPETDLSGAQVVADTIRKAIQAKELLKRSTGEKLGRVTASFGIAMYRSGETAASFIERADRCLYVAKNSGRNRVVGEDELSLHDEVDLGSTAAA